MSSLYADNQGLLSKQKKEECLVNKLIHDSRKLLQLFLVVGMTIYLVFMVKSVGVITGRDILPHNNPQDGKQAVLGSTIIFILLIQLIEIQECLKVKKLLEN